MKKLIYLLAVPMLLAFILSIRTKAAEVTVTGTDSAAIQAALDQAKNTAEAVTVTVPAGTYTINVPLFIYSGTTLNLKENTIFDSTVGGGHMIAPTADDQGSATDITINGGQWKAAGVLPFNINNTTNCTISGCRVSAKNPAVTTGQTFLVVKSSQVTISYCTMKDSQMGVYVSESQNCTISHNEMVGHTSQGVLVDAASSAITIDSNSILNTLQAVQSLSGNPITVSNNRIDASQTIGIDMLGQATISGNVITNSGVTAIWMKNGVNATISANKVDTSSAVAINIDGCPSVTVSGNTLNNNSTRGIQVVHSKANVKDNTINGCGYTAPTSTPQVSEGITVDEGLEGTRITGNTVTATLQNFDNTGNGIIIATNSTGVVVDGNIVQNNGNHGIQVTTGSTNVQVSNNTVTTTGRHGITYSKNATGTVSGNTVTDAHRSGMAFDKACEVVVKNNKIMNSAHYGMYVVGEDVEGYIAAPKAIITGNTIDGCGSDAIYSGININPYFVSERYEVSNNIVKNCNSGIILGKNCLATVTGNTVSGFSQYGIYFMLGSVGGTMANNNALTTNANASSAYGIAMMEGLVNENGFRNWNLINEATITATAASGHTWGGQTVTVLAGGQEYTQVADGSGNFNIAYPAQSSTAVDAIKVKSTDAVGNSVWINTSVIAASEPPKKPIDMDALRSYVERMYTKVLERPSEVSGMTYWTDAIAAGSETGASTAAVFVFGQEYTGKNSTNEQYIKMLYRTFFGREADDAWTYWIDLMDKGASRKLIFKNFIESDEYKAICDTYGIPRGTYDDLEYRDRNMKLTGFMVRAYDRVLERRFDEEGLEFWCSKLYTGEMNVKQVLIGAFFESAEIKAKNLNDVDFVKICYSTFLERDFDQAGYDYWIGGLNNKTMTRDTILEDFYQSAEFKTIMKNYDIVEK